MKINIHRDKEKHCYNNHYTRFHNPYCPDETSSDRYKSYYINHIRHNPYGPATTYPNSRVIYCLNGIHYSKYEWELRRHEY